MQEQAELAGIRRIVKKVLYLLFSSTNLFGQQEGERHAGFAERFV
jgi:hypothetical protein